MTAPHPRNGRLAAAVRRRAGPVWANSPWGASFEAFWSNDITLKIGAADAARGEAEIAAIVDA